VPLLRYYFRINISCLQNLWHTEDNTIHTQKEDIEFVYTSLVDAI
jgi:hypothetical protein